MAEGTAVSGKHGTLFKIGSPNVEIEFGQWSFDAKCDIHVYASNKTGGKKKRIAGNSDATGQVSGKRMTDAPIEDILEEGGTYLLRFHFTETTYIEATCVIENISQNVDTDSGDIEAFSFSYGTDGDWSYVN